MQSSPFSFGTYSVAMAEKREIGNEWNYIKWNMRHLQFQYHRLYYLTSGRAILRLLDRKLELEAGNVYFIPAFSVAGSSIDGVMEKYWVHFQADFPLLDMYRYISERYSVKANERTDMLFDTVLDTYKNPSCSASMRLQGAMNLIMADFLDGITADLGRISRFLPVLDYVNHNYRDKISLSDLASIINVSPMYFANLFKSAFNISPRQYILNKRLTESQRLLLSTELTVKEIAYEVGFDNENYFSEFFTSKVGVCARDFRNRELSDIFKPETKNR